MNLLQITLLCNGVFSLASGLFLLLFRNKMALWFGREKSILFLIIGFALLYFSYSIFKEVKSPNLESVVFIIVQDLVWVVASIAILWAKPFSISLLGNQIIAIVALIVLIFGIGQSVGVSQIDSIGDSEHKQLQFERTVNASKENVWKVVADVANYHQVAPNIDRVEILSGQGKGMVRRCSHKTDHWTEVATLWEEGEQYVFEVDTGAEDYPYPLKHLQGTWKVEKVSERQTRIIMIFEFKYNRKIHSLILHPFMKTQFNKICEALLDNWQTELEKGEF